MNKLDPNEIAVIQMGLQVLIEDTTEASQNPAYPFTPESRKDMSDILRTAKSALSKIELASGCEVRLDPFVEGDEQEFLTKQS